MSSIRSSLAVSLLLLVGCATGDATSADDADIQGGKTDRLLAHNFAVGIASKQGALCSGTLIAPNLVLTARHCVVPANESDIVTCDEVFGKTVAASQIFVSTEATLRGAKKFYAAKEITTPADTAFCGNDLALVTLKENVPDDEATPAIPAVRFSMTDRSRVGGRIAAVGYGITNPSARDSGTRRLREQIKIVCVPGDASYDCKASGYASLADSDKEFITAGYVCSGDSGGGAFDQTSFSRGTPIVLGALSRGPQTEEQCLAAIYTRTDAHAKLILETARRAAEAGGYAEPTWLSDDLEVALAVGDPIPDEAPSFRFTGRTIHDGCTTSPGPTPAPWAALALALTWIVAQRRRSNLDQSTPAA